MNEKILQEFIDEVKTKFGIKMEVKLCENIQDVPSEYLALHMLSNGFTNLKKSYEKENGRFLKVYREESIKRRKRNLTQRSSSSNQVEVPVRIIR